MHKEFVEEHLEDILKQIAEKLSQETKIYVFGGAVMVYNKLKPSTKDIDILFDNEEDYHRFLKAARDSGFVNIYVPLEYQEFKLSAMLKNYRKEWRLDIFLKKVCGKFQLTKTVESRAKLFKEINHLKIYFLSFEDIFMMKSLTLRERDLGDMKNILGFGINFEIISDEIRNQKEFQWEIIERLLDFEEKYNLKLPIEKEMKEAYYQHNQEISDRLTKKQINSMLQEGKSKKEIIDYFQLTEEEWKQFTSS